MTTRSSLCIYTRRPCSGVWQRYDAVATDGDTGNTSSARAFTLLISALKRLVTSPHVVLLGVSAQRHGVGVPVTDSQLHLHSHLSLDSAADGDDGCQRDGVERRWDNWH